MPVLQPAEPWRRTGRYEIDELFKLQDRKGAEMVLAMTHEEVVTDARRAGRALLPRPAADPLPLPGQGARRAAPARRRAAHARVHHEGLLHLRPRRGGPRRALRQARRRLRPHLRAHRAGVVPGRVRRRDDGRHRAPTSTWRRAPPARTTSRSRPATPPTSRSRAPTRSRSSCPPPLSAPEEVHDAGPDDRRGGRRARSASPPGALLKAFPVIAEDRGLVLVARARRPPRQRDQAAQRAGRRLPPGAAGRVRASGSAPPASSARSAPTRRSCSTTPWPTAATSPAPTAPTSTCAASSPAATSPSSAPTSARSRRATRSAAQAIRIEPAIEVGNIFKLGTRYSRAARRDLPRRGGHEQPIWMGSYGIGPARIVAAAVEQFADEAGIAWPRCARALRRRARRARQSREPRSTRTPSSSTTSCARPASTCSTTTATSGPARSSPTPSCSAARCGSRSGKRTLSGGELEVQVPPRPRDARACRSSGAAEAVRELWRTLP